MTTTPAITRPCRRTVAAALRMLAAESRRLAEANAATGREFMARYHTSAAKDYSAASRRLTSSSLLSSVSNSSVSPS